MSILIFASKVSIFNILTVEPSWGTPPQAFGTRPGNCRLHKEQEADVFLAGDEAEKGWKPVITLRYNFVFQRRTHI